MSSLEKIYQLVRTQAGADKVGQTPSPDFAVACVVARRHPELQILLVKRVDTLRFLPGTWCFPGGRVESNDARACAIREVFEETGLDLANQNLVQATTFVTPDYAPIRFSAIYFYALLDHASDSLDISASAGEISEARWMTVRDAVAAWHRGEMIFASPVWRTLLALAKDPSEWATTIAQAQMEENAEPYVWEASPFIDMLPQRSLTLPPATHTNCYLLGGDEFWAVDPGGSEDDQLAHLFGRIDKRIACGDVFLGVALTHHHGDHHAGTAALVARYAKAVWAHPETLSRIPRYPDMRALYAGEKVSVGKNRRTEIACIFTPGHAPGHLCFVEAGTQHALVGDLVATFGTILIDPDEGDMGIYIASLELARSQNWRTMFPAHGTPITNVREKLTFYIQHRLWRETRVCEELAKGAANETDLVARVYADTPALLHPVAHRSLLAHLHKLQREGKAYMLDEKWQQNSE